MEQIRMNEQQYHIVLTLIKQNRESFPQETDKIERIIEEYANQSVPDYFGFHNYVIEKLQEEMLYMPFMEVHKNSIDTFMAVFYIHLLTIKRLYEDSSQIVEHTKENHNLIKLHISSFNNHERFILSLIGQFGFHSKKDAANNIRDLSEYETKALFIYAYNKNDKDLALKAWARLNNLDEGEYEYFEGLIYYKDQQYIRAIELLKQIKKGQPDYISSQLTLSKIYAISGLYNEFLAAMKNVLSFVPLHMGLIYVQILLRHYDGDKLDSVYEAISSFLPENLQKMKQGKEYELEFKEQTLSLIIEKGNLLEELSFIRHNQIDNERYVDSIKHQISLVDKAIELTNPNHKFLLDKMDGELFYQKIMSGYLREYIDEVDQDSNKRTLNFALQENQSKIPRLLITKLGLMLLDKKQVMKEYFILLSARLIFRHMTLNAQQRRLNDETNRESDYQGLMSDGLFDNTDIDDDHKMKTILNGIISDFPNILSSSEIDEFNEVFSTAIRLGDEKIYQIALVHADGLNLIDSAHIRKIEQENIYKTLSSRGKVAFLSVEKIADQMDLDKNTWVDAGNISLGYYKLLEIEFNNRLIIPTVNSINIDEYKQTFMMCRDSLSKPEQLQFKYRWNKLYRTILDIHKENKNSMLIGEIYQLLDGLSRSGGDFNPFSTYLRNQVVNFITDEGLVDLDNGSLYDCLSSENRNKFRNPPAHIEYLSNQVALEAIKFTKITLLYLATRFRK
jgi:hypothetical protein